MRVILTILAGLSFVFSSPAFTKVINTSHWRTKNGAQVIFHQAMEVPMVDISITFAAGSAYDGEDEGLSALTASLINQGNGGFDANAIAEKLANSGAQYEAENDRDTAVFSLKSLVDSNALKEAVSTFALIINHPDFPEQAFIREKNQQLMAIAQDEESPDKVANQTFFKALYQQHPYAHPLKGTKESVNLLTAEKVRRFYQNFFVGENAIVVLVGAIDEKTAHSIAEEVTAQLPKGHAAPPIPKAHPLTEEMNIEIQFPSSQTVLRLGQLGIDHHNQHYFPLMVGNYSLGGGVLVSRLALEVREKRGLTYGVYSQFVPMPGLGPFIISLSTKNEQANTATEVTRETLSSFVSNGPKEQELTAAKQYLTGSFPLALASNSSIASMLRKIAFYKLPENYLDTYISNINATGVKEVKEAFQQLIHPNQLLQVSVGRK